MQELLTKRPSNNKQRFDQRSQVGQVLDSFLMRASNLTVPTMPTLSPKLRRKVPYDEPRSLVKTNGEDGFCFRLS